MKIAITADLHLTSQKEHPERYHALQNIFEQIRALKIRTLVIAGDLFNEKGHDYLDFEKYCQKHKPEDLNIFIIPGNHDFSLENKYLSIDKVQILSETTIINFDNGLPFLFIPYKKDRTMGEDIAANSLPANKWVLVGHGDWYEGLREPNPVEPGVYMPLTRPDIQIYRPLKVILGHIHKPTDSQVVHYPGSPCGLDITETGHRRLIVIDTDNGQTEEKRIQSDVLYFDESIVVYPHEGEVDAMQEHIKRIIEQWGITEEEKKRVEVRVKVSGYSLDRAALITCVQKGFSEYKLYGQELDVSGLMVSEDVERAEIAARVAKYLRQIDWTMNIKEPDKKQMLLEALKTIYSD